MALCGPSFAACCRQGCGQRTPRLKTSPVCQNAWAAWRSGRQHGQRRQRVGPRGSTCSRCTNRIGPCKVRRSSRGLLAGNGTQRGRSSPTRLRPSHRPGQMQQPAHAPRIAYTDGKAADCVVYTATCGANRRAPLHSHAGGAASVWLRAIPSGPAFVLEPLLKPRASPMERTWARELRESGARVMEHVLLSDMGMQSVDPGNGRHVDIVANGLPLGGGVPMVVDATLVSPLRADGTPHERAEMEHGMSLRRAGTRKMATYPELAGEAFAAHPF